jgi:hypothetical protein
MKSIRAVMFPVKIGARHVAGGLLLQVLLSGHPAVAEVTKLVQMRLIDGASKEPIAGAHVTYSAEAREAMKLFEIHVQSDAEGVVTLPPTRFDAKAFGLFGLNTNYESPLLTISKTGYRRMQLQNTHVVASPSVQDLLRWDHNGATIELKRSDAASQAGDAHANAVEAVRPAYEKKSIARPDRLPATELCVVSRGRSEAGMPRHLNDEARAMDRQYHDLGRPR